jgi:hypothetical protein
MSDFAKLRMQTLRAERSATTDVHLDTESNLGDVRRAKEWQRKLGEEIPDGTERVTFPGPHSTGPVRELRWNPSDGIAPDIDPIDNLTDEDLHVVFGAAKDAQPTVMSFYAGKSFSEGRRLHNQHRVSQGLRPIPEGKK